MTVRIPLLTLFVRRLEERRKEFICVLLTQPYALVLDWYHYLPRCCVFWEQLDLNGNDLFILRELYGVWKQVDQHLLHSVNIDFEKALSLSGTQIIQVNFLMRSLDLHDVDDFFNFFVQIIKVQIWLPNLVFEQTSIQQVFNLEFKDVCPMSDHFS